MSPWAIVLIVVVGLLIVSFNFYLFVIGTSDKRRDIVERYRGGYFAHRGLHGNGVAENSLRGYELACQHGFGIELDVRLTKDGVPVLFHDPDIECDGKRVLVEELEYEVLKTLPIGGDGADRVPTMREMLDLVNGRVPLLVEIKEKAGRTDVARAAVELLKDYTGPYIMESFEPSAMKYVRRMMPEVPLGILCCRYWRDPANRSLRTLFGEFFFQNVHFRPDFVSYKHDEVKGAPLFLLRKVFDPPMMAWTVRSAEEERVACENGFEYIIFENYIPTLENSNEI